MKEGKCQVIHVVCFVLSFSATSLFAEDVVYKDDKTAEAELLPMKDVKAGWSCVARGGDFFASTSYKNFDGFGNTTYSSWTISSSKHSGAVLAIPVGDFVIKRKFKYKGPNRDGIKKELDGLLICVKVQVSTGSGSGGNIALQRAVENMVKTGVSLSKGVGCKPMKYRALTESAKKRFGARLLRFRYCGNSSSILLLLLDCDFLQADDSFMPATPQALTRDGRLALAKKLRPNEDKGGLTIFSSETEVHPVGSPHAPFGNGWQNQGDGVHRRNDFFDSRRKGIKVDN